MTTAELEISSGVEAFFGTNDENIRLLESGLNVETHLLPHCLEVKGPPDQVARMERILSDYQSLLSDGQRFSAAELTAYLKVLAEAPDVTFYGLVNATRSRSFGRKQIAPRSPNQLRYLEAIDRLDLVFGIGPAGTGKTYLAVAMAVSDLLAKRVRRIVLTRPAVEAGESLGFLPGTLQQKIDPYLRPLYDALYDMLDAEKVEKYVERGTIEVAPLAFMRGRSLKESFIILDEGQNTTSEQMKMFLTRLDIGSKMVITGDRSQIDLPRGQRSGLLEAMEILYGVSGIDFVHFESKDVVRHDLVARIVRAYDDSGSDVRAAGS